MIRKVILLLLSSCILLGGIFGQSIQDSIPGQQQHVEIEHADVYDYSQRNDSVFQKLIGEVEMSQDSVYMYCDSAIIANGTWVLALGDEVLIQQGDSLAAFADTIYYDGELKLAELIGNVILVNGDRKLFTQHMLYDLNTKVATYTTPGTLTDGETQLSSNKGYYYVDENIINFKDSVVVIHPEFNLRADTLQFNTTTQMVDFLGPTIIQSDSSQIYCEAGFYDVENNQAEFREHAQYEKGEQRASADVIRYDGENGVYVLEGDAVFTEGDFREASADVIRYELDTETYELIGNAFSRDSTRTIIANEVLYNAEKGIYSTKGRSQVVDPPQILEADNIDYSDEDGMGLAKGNVVWQDTSLDLTIQCLEAAYNQNTGYLKATGGLRGRPLLITLVDGDSLYMTADTLLSMHADTSAQDSSRLLLAYNDVRLFKTDMQALCDSLAYSSADSLFRLFREPIIWADTSQFVADTMFLQLANQSLDRIFLNSKSFIINSPDEKFFNQIKGRYIVAHFKEGNLRKMNVEGNAEAIYYAQDDAKAYIGVNKTACSEMVMHFDNNAVQRILFLTSPEGQLDPMGAVDHEEIRLEDFNWQTEPRPKSFDDLFGPPLRKLKPLQKGTSYPRPAISDEEKPDGVQKPAGKNPTERPPKPRGGGL